MSRWHVPHGIPVANHRAIYLSLYLFIIHKKISDDQGAKETRETRRGMKGDVDESMEIVTLVPEASSFFLNCIEKTWNHKLHVRK